MCDVLYLKMYAYCIHLYGNDYFDNQRHSKCQFLIDSVLFRSHLSVVDISEMIALGKVFL